jgi:hypothetical protein
MNVQILGQHPEIILGIRHCRLDQFVHGCRSSLWHQIQDTQRLQGIHTPNMINDQAHFARRLPNMPAFSPDFKVFHAYPLFPPRLGPPLFLLDVTPEGASRREFAQLMTNHVLADIDRHVSSPIVDSNRVPNHLWENGRRP